MDGTARTAVTIVVPTFNEAGNVEELVRQVAEATAGLEAELVFVDDSTDGTPQVIETVAARTTALPVALLHREVPVGGLGGAVLEGVARARHDLVLVMDGDLQHPPAMIPVLVRTAAESGADLVVASRYTGTGDAGGLANGVRRMVSKGSTIVTRAMFPSRLAQCTDPMTGFFVLRRSTVETASLQPRGFKILLEIIARQRRKLRIVEEPFVFGERFAGESKATFRQGVDFLRQLVALRFGKMSGFALIGAFGAVLNIGLVAVLTAEHMGYLAASVLASALTIVTNFLLAERFVFRDLIAQARPRGQRFLASVSFNGIEAAVRVYATYLLVDRAGWNVVLTTAVTLAVAFLVRFSYHSLFVYAARETGRGAVPSVDRVVQDTAAPVRGPLAED
ncbi:glycosyltransferase [Cellulomonas endophytica]|uniref:glycosyltransferase n=1 Tax=Cellulomonas endophytica TaxID=2494735 RepID=UPI0010104639|nr:glycosyltransferase family 2 protein [Cellulomonas endophytica]